MKIALWFALTVASVAADRFPNVAETSTLPRGAGFAAKYTADSGIAQNAAVIFSDDYEEGELGARWDEKTSTKANALSLAPARHAAGGERCMRVDARLGQNTGGGLTKWFTPVDLVYVRFYTHSLIRVAITSTTS